ncbi:hypothetical protein HZC00_04360 [Candidatus Kaiserbacteria bacterium]|nr:hypothetical protein [Candidatus Kaiserbacteria bacterium]
MKIEITSEDQKKLQSSLKGAGKTLILLFHIALLVIAFILILGGPALGNWTLALAGVVLGALTIFAGEVLSEYGLM